MREPLSPFVRLIIEGGPLLAFFIANGRYGIFVGTGVFMAATVLSIAASYWQTGRLPAMPLATGVFVLAFGGLTLWLQDDFFIKIKPTIVNGLIAAILAGGLALGRPLLRLLLGPMIPLTDTGWRVLTWRWVAWFVALALFNEASRHFLSTDAWVSARLFVTMPATILFSLAQVPLIRRYHAAPAGQNPGL